MGECAPNQPLQRTRFAPRDRCYFRWWFRAECYSDLDGAPLNGNPLGRSLECLLHRKARELETNRCHRRTCSRTVSHFCVLASTFTKDRHMPARVARPIEHYSSLSRQLITFFLPVSEVTIYSPLGLDQARQRLSDRLQFGLEQTSGSGIFQDRRRYQGQLSNDHLTLRGPYGYKKWGLTTHGSFRADREGSLVELKMQLDLGYAVFALSLLLPFGCFLAALFSRNLILAPCVIVPVMVLYSALLISVKVEAETIKDLLVAILSMEPRT
jgi:hypothetical protein